MSQTKVEVVRRLFQVAQEGLRRADPGAAFDEFVLEGLTVSNLQGGLTGSAVVGIDDVVGRDGYAELMARFTEDFADFWMEVEEVIDADDCVVATVHITGRGKGSGALVELRMGAVYAFEAGRIVRVDMFPDRNHALRAVGVRE